MSKSEARDNSDLTSKSELISTVARSLFEKYLVITEQQGEIMIQSTMDPEELLFHINEIKKRITNNIQYH